MQDVSGERRRSYRLFVGNCKEKVHVESLGVDGRMQHIWGKGEVQTDFGGENRGKESALKAYAQMR